MKIELEMWHLILMLMAFFGCVGAFGKLLLDQIERRLEARFDNQERRRSEDHRHWDEKFAALENAGRSESAQWARIERELLELKVDLPKEYVRREDYVSNQVILESKMDRIFSKLENLQLQGRSQQ